MSKLILARHGETPYNAAGRWTGHTDIDLGSRGKEEALRAGNALLAEGIAIDLAFASKLKRTRSTLDGILSVLGVSIPVVETPALNERDYGVFTGMSKQQVKAELGEEEFFLIRRGWDHPIENGETLKRVHDDRIVPFHLESVLPALQQGSTTLVVSSNNPLRAYVKYIEGISDEEVGTIELGTAEVRIYDYGVEQGLLLEAVHKIGDVH